MHIIECALQASDIWTKTRPQHREIHALLFTISASHYSKDAGDGAYSLSSLSEKTRISNYFADVIAKAAYSPQLF